MLVIAILASAFSILFNFLVPQIISFCVDSVIGQEQNSILCRIFGFLLEKEHLWRNVLLCTAGIVACALFAALFNYLSKLGIAKGTEGFIKKLRDRLFSHIQRLPFSWHTKTQTGDIIQRCISDVDTIRRFISAQLIEVIRTVLLVSIAMALMFSMNGKLALICLATIPVIVLYSQLFYKRISREFRGADEAEGEVMIAVQENLTGVRVVRAFGRENFEKRRFAKRIDCYAKKWIDLGYTTGFFWGIGDFATCMQLVIVVVMGSVFAVRGELSLGQFLAFISYTQTIAAPVRNLGKAISECSKAGVSIDRIWDILDAEEEPHSQKDQKPDMRADIVFENVSFSYGGTQVLHNLTFRVRRGTTVGILGTTGAGKSTITYLLNRLYELPEENGAIFIGQTDIRDIDRTHLRKNIGLVLQEPFLFSKTVRQNIEIAAEPDFAKVREMARVASVDEDILAFANQYDTVVGERGVTLSGGQKQRIAIARTLMLDCPIMIFDDSMSAVDMQTDAAIRDALRKKTGEATVIMISHRINTLMHADQIIVLEDGRLTQQGTHEELMRQQGYYRRVYEMQSNLLKGEGDAGKGLE